MTREEAIKVLTEVMNNYHIDSMKNRRIDEALSVAIQALKAEPKKGRWIWRGGNLYECSECKAIVVAQDYIPIELHKFCRGCGAEMRGGEK